MYSARVTTQINVKDMSYFFRHSVPTKIFLLFLQSVYIYVYIYIVIYI